jgi:hypothetical protein
MIGIGAGLARSVPERLADRPGARIGYDQYVLALLDGEAAVDDGGDRGSEVGHRPIICARQWPASHEGLCSASRPELEPVG